MESFLDTTVIIKYIEYDYIKEWLRKKCFEHIKSSKGKILISFIVKEEAQRAVLKRKEMYETVIKKIKDPSFAIDYKKSLFLSKSDGLFTEELSLELKESNLENLKQDFNSEIDFLNVSLAKFFKNNVSELFINKNELDKNIVFIINEFISDFADCRVLTSAIQIQQNKEQFLFVTADKHFDPNGYEFLKGEPRLKDYKFPELKNFLYDD
jgi:hypothetical protein